MINNLRHALSPCLVAASRQSCNAQHLVAEEEEKVVGVMAEKKTEIALAIVSYDI